VHREDFIPDPYKKLAFADVNIPLAHDQATMTPRVEARLLQALDISPVDRILEIGTGCAYLTALLSQLGREVYSIDIFPDFTETARRKLAERQITNVTLLTGDASRGWPEHAPYDVIAVTGSLPAPDREIERQLEIGGRLFAVIGESPVMEATLVTRVGEEAFSREVLFETDLPPLIGAGKADRFRF
jgi:protein-L-isoaspartate(D-aspartate) O-methyltransferase